MEVFRDNRIDKGIRPQMAAFHLLSEPWLFTFDRSGKVAARIAAGGAEPSVLGGRAGVRAAPSAALRASPYAAPAVW